VDRRAWPCKGVSADFTLDYSRVILLLVHGPSTAQSSGKSSGSCHKIDARKVTLGSFRVPLRFQPNAISCDDAFCTARQWTEKNSRTVA